MLLNVARMRGLLITAPIVAASNDLLPNYPPSYTEAIQTNSPPSVTGTHSGMKTFKDEKPQRGNKRDDVLPEVTRPE